MRCPPHPRPRCPEGGLPVWVAEVAGSAWVGLWGRGEGGENVDVEWRAPPVRQTGLGNRSSRCLLRPSGPQKQVGFNADEAHNIVKECVDGVLGGEDYNQNNINQWTASIVEQSLTHLVKLGKAYKYIVTCAVVQRSAYGFHTASSCFWDTTSDGTCTVRWENRTMNCIVNVFAIAIVL